MIKLIFAVLAMFVCGCSSSPPKVEFPANVAEWRITAPPAETGGKWTASYQGQPDIVVEVTRMSSTTTAFSAVQSWRAEVGKLAFYHGRYFGLVSAPTADQRTLNRFVAAFEKSLPQ